MKSMLGGFALVVVLAVGAWWVLSDVVDYTRAERTGDAVRLD